MDLQRVFSWVVASFLLAPAVSCQLGDPRVPVWRPHGQAFPVKGMFPMQVGNWYFGMSRDAALKECKRSGGKATVDGAGRIYCAGARGQPLGARHVDLGFYRGGLGAIILSELSESSADTELRRLLQTYGPSEGDEVLEELCDGLGGTVHSWQTVGDGGTQVVVSGKTLRTVGGIVLQRCATGSSGTFAYYDVAYGTERDGENSRQEEFAEGRATALAKNEEELLEAKKAIAANEAKIRALREEMAKVQARFNATRNAPAVQPTPAPVRSGVPRSRDLESWIARSHEASEGSVCSVNDASQRVCRSLDGGDLVFVGEFLPAAGFSRLVRGRLNLSSLWHKGYSLGMSETAVRAECRQEGRHFDHMDQLGALAKGELIDGIQEFRCVDAWGDLQSTFGFKAKRLVRVVWQLNTDSEIDDVLRLLRERHGSANTVRRLPDGARILSWVWLANDGKNTRELSVAVTNDQEGKFWMAHGIQ